MKSHRSLNSPAELLAAVIVILHVVVVINLYMQLLLLLLFDAYKQHLFAALIIRSANILFSAAEQLISPRAFISSQRQLCSSARVFRSFSTQYCLYCLTFLRHTYIHTYLYIRFNIFARCCNLSSCLLQFSRTIQLWCCTCGCCCCCLKLDYYNTFVIVVRSTCIACHTQAVRLYAWLNV